MGAMRSVAILLGAVACGLSIYSLISPFWAVNIQNMGGMQSMGTKALGLWKFCTKSTGQGNYQCQPLSQLGIQQLAKMGIVGFRILSIIGMIAGISGLFAGITSSDAVNVAKSTGDKNKAAGGAAGSFLLAGIMILGASSWAAHKIIRQYANMNFNGSMFQGASAQWTLGAGIYCGWVAAAIFLGSSAMMFCGCCSQTEEDEYEDDIYQPAHPQAYAESAYSQGRKEFV